MRKPEGKLQKYTELNENENTTYQRECVGHSNTSAKRELFSKKCLH